MAAHTATDECKVNGEALIVAVTGGNKGVGFACCHALASAKGVHCILTARDEGRGRKAVEALRRAGLTVGFALLDVSDASSCDAFVDHIATTYGRLDCLLNNAGVNNEGAEYSKAVATFNTNLWGAMNISERVVPLVCKSTRGRIVNVCSQLGRLHNVSKELQRQVRSTATDRDGLVALGQQFLAAVKDGTAKKKGWPAPTAFHAFYSTSKMLQIAYSKELARRLADHPNVEVNACCPGWCKTDMSHHRGPRSPEKGAETLVWLCLREPQSPPDTGKFYQDKKIHPW